MRIAALVMCLAVVGCAATKTGVVSIGENTYMISNQDWMAYSGGVVKAELYREAAAFCTSKGKKVVPGQSTSRDASYGASASAEIQFRCE